MNLRKAGEEGEMADDIKTQYPYCCNIDDERFMKDGVTNRSDFLGVCEKCGLEPAFLTQAREKVDEVLC